MKLKKDRDFFSLFDDKTGFYLRSGILKDGKDTGVDPFMASFPELLDVGIMGHCTHGKTGLCLKAGVQCYQRGLDSNKPNMRLEDFRWIAEQCRERVFQFALGGCGDPDQHESFVEILQICRENHIVPNFTTSGYGMTKEIASQCARYCGAVAVSWYRSNYTTKAIEMLIEAGVRTNIHYVLSTCSVQEAVERLRRSDFPLGINAVIFLLHKPIGLGTSDLVLRIDSPALREFFSLVDSSKFPFKVGFDSCSVPMLIRELNNIDLTSVDTCEGARWSAYITPDLKMLPCSFDNQHMRWAVDLGESSIESAWRSPQFDDFRRHLRNACPTCRSRSLCMGGCPICPEIVLCKETHRMGLRA